MAEPFVLPIWPGAAPGSEGWTQQEQTTISKPHGHQFVRNITVPTLTVMLPDPEKATGAAALVCPGGGFHFLTMDNEGTFVGDWLNARGIAAFVVKYRVAATPPSDVDFEADGQRMWTQTPEERERHMAEVTREIVPLAVADAQQAMRIVREHASEWDINPTQVGAIGFSAGGRVVTGMALEYDAETRPAFIAPIYGALYNDLNVPTDAPPAFIAVANDDVIASEPCLRLYQAWRAAGKPVELHVYSQGGHGFGLLKQGLPSDAWIERMHEWLLSPGILDR